MLSLFSPTATVVRVNLKKHSDRLDILLARYEREIRETEEKLQALKAGRDSLSLMAAESPKPTRSLPPEKFRDAGITKTVLHAINDLWRMRKDAVPLTED
jgi:hypothetical protein